MFLKARQLVKSLDVMLIYNLEILPKFLLVQISKLYYLFLTSDCIVWGKRGTEALNIACYVDIS